MRARLDVLPAGIEDAQFKRMPDGWLFSTPSPWVLAPRRTYRISDAQKPALAARVRASRYVRLLVLLVLLAALVGLVVAFPGLLPRDRMSVLIGFIAVMTAAITSTDFLMVRPLLRDAARSTERIGLVDMLRAQTASLSLAALVIFNLVFVLAAASNVVAMPSSTNAFFSHGVGAISFSVLAVLFGSMLIGKLRAPQPVGAPDTIMSVAAEQRVRRDYYWNMLWAFVVVVVAVGGLGALMAWLIG